MKRINPSILAGAIAFIITAIVAHGRSTPYNNYVLLADAFVHGRAWIDWPGPYIDALAFNGQHYVIEAPLPAIVLMPFVLVFGTHANQTLLAILFAAIAIGAAFQIGENFAIPRERTAWICGFALAGTDLLWCAMLGDVWFIAHVASVCFTMLALAELTGKRRSWLVALWAACAAESRFTMVLAIPVYGYLLSFEGPRLASTRRLVPFVAMLVPFAVFWVGYNLARWGTWNDLGYTLWYHQDQAGSPSGSPFQLAYLGYELHSFFVELPTRLGAYPWLRPEMTGVALTWTSPALLLAFFARGPLRWVAALWILTLLTAAPNFIYYVNGFAQFGMRHALDFEPFLVALMLLAVREKMPRWSYALIAYSIVAGIWGCWYWNSFFRATS